MTLGPYEILSRLGEGGMGEVWRARDRSLDREVAIKVLPEAFTSDPQRLDRFEREARVLATLKHPGIGHIYGLEDTGRSKALVLELVEGCSLAELLSRGPIAPNRALQIARQIAQALEVAHERGIVHRDLKPSNVMVSDLSSGSGRTSAGAVKVVDFGLAKAVRPTTESVASASATLPISGQTEPGAIVGTLPYMSPEQARGMAVDRRTDLWSLGCVLFEMLTGERPFKGDSASDLLAAILAKDPDWELLEKRQAPRGAKRLVRRCLAKEVGDRFRDAGDVALEIEDLGETLVDVSSPETKGGWVGRWLPWWIAAAALAGVTYLGLRVTETTPAPARVVKLDVELPNGEVLAYDRPSLVLSPDGSSFAYVGRADGATRLYVREIDSLGALELPGTEGAMAPFFSPDGREIGFFAEGEMRKISVTGSGLQTLSQAPEANGASWGEDGQIVFAPNEHGPLVRVPDSGGEPEVLTRLLEDEGELLHRWPQVLPGAELVLFTSATRRGDFEDARIEIQSLVTGERQRLVERAYFGRYAAAAGRLLFVRRGTLYARSFDLDSLEWTGPPTSALPSIVAHPRTGAADLSFDRRGSLLYRAGRWHFEEASALFVGRQGERQPFLETPGLYYSPRYSPDGRRLSMQVGGGRSMSHGGDSDVWVYDPSRSSAARLTVTDGPEHMPVWTRDGQRLVFSAERESSAPNLFWMRADGSGPPVRLTETELRQYPCSFSPDGRVLVLIQEPPHKEGWDLWALEFDQDGPVGEPKPLLETPYLVWRAEVSPDGRWLAYTSFQSSSAQIWVSPFPALDRRWQVSAEAEHFPNLLARWSQTAPELYYRVPGGMKVVSYEVENGDFVPGRPRMLFEGEFANRGWPDWDLRPDGEQFVMFELAKSDVGQDRLVRRDGESIPEARTVMVLDWFSEFR